jgi:hypothetical protein
LFAFHSGGIAPLEPEPCAWKTLFNVRHFIGMTDDAYTQLRERMARLSERAIARIHENRPELRGKSAEQTIMLLKMEEQIFRRRPGKKIVSDEVEFEEGTEARKIAGDPPGS